MNVNLKAQTIGAIREFVEAHMWLCCNFGGQRLVT